MTHRKDNHLIAGERAIKLKNNLKEGYLRKGVYLLGIQ